LRSLLQDEGSKVRWVVFCEKCQWLLHGEDERAVGRIEVNIPSYAKTWRDIEELERRIRNLEKYLQVRTRRTGESKSSTAQNASRSGEREKESPDDAKDSF
jgi:hypothetical protein